MADLWYREIADFDFNTYQSRNGNDVGHFTQIVWDASSSLGCGLAVNSTSRRFVGVSRYTPTGNINPVDWFKVNVYPLPGSSSSSTSNTGTSITSVKIDDSNC